MSNLISPRLACCADMVCPGAAVADIGTDHGHLAIHLLRSGRASKVTAADVREKPLEKAKNNAAAAGVAEKITFCLCDGLTEIQPDSVDTVICAGMGGDTIVHILQQAPWIRDARYTLILQPQTSGNDLRRYLGNKGFQIETERLVRDAGKIYFAMRVHYGGGRPLTPGEQYVSPQILETADPLLPAYLERVIGGLRRAVQGIARAKQGDAQKRMDYYETALKEVLEMRERL
jgi:tRNA (adenine22-N1)-methyltransferase